MNEETNTGVTCPCGRFLPFEAYVFAHWAYKLTHACECGRVLTVCEGEIQDVTEPDPEHRDPNPAER